MTVRIRPELAAAPKYVPGASAPGAIKLASNEVSRPPLPSVVAAIAEAANEVNRYPNHGASELRDALGEFLGIDRAQIAFGAGSVEICYDLVRLTCNAPTDEVLFAWRSFEAYPIAARVGGAQSVTVGLNAQHEHDLDAMAAAVTDNTRLIFVCNPNNPTGTLLPTTAIEEFLNKVPDHILVALDEAYYEYTDPTDDVSLDLIKRHPNVIVLRTFSKAYGLAGLRIGYAVGEQSLISSLAAIRLPFSVSRVAQAAALASLEASGELMSRVKDLVTERDRVAAAVAQLGLAAPTSRANFIYLPVGDDAKQFAQMCADNGVILRAFAGDGVRATIGEPTENDVLIRAIQAAVASI